MVSSYSFTLVSLIILISYELILKLTSIELKDDLLAARTASSTLKTSSRGRLR
jgi:hypothetical protein